MNGTWLTVMADSGSSINILNEGNFEKLKQPRLELRAMSTRVYPYESETPIQMQGKFKASIKTEAGVESEETIHVTDGWNWGIIA